MTPYMANYSLIVVCENLPLVRSPSEVTDAGLAVQVGWRVSFVKGKGGHRFLWFTISDRFGSSLPITLLPEWSGSFIGRGIVGGGSVRSACGIVGGGDRKALFIRPPWNKFIRLAILLVPLGHGPFYAIWEYLYPY